MYSKKDTIGYTIHQHFQKIATADVFKVVMGLKNVDFIEEDCSHNGYGNEHSSPQKFIFLELGKFKK